MKLLNLRKQFLVGLATLLTLSMLSLGAMAQSDDEIEDRDSWWDRIEQALEDYQSRVIAEDYFSRHHDNLVDLLEAFRSIYYTDQTAEFQRRFQELAGAEFGIYIIDNEFGVFIPAPEVNAEHPRSNAGPNRFILTSGIEGNFLLTDQGMHFERNSKGKNAARRFCSGLPPVHQSGCRRQIPPDLPVEDDDPPFQDEEFQ
ncbi:MAG: hypothetical protein AB8E15_00545 [Bdellovibrionales bacterium]